MKLVSVVCVFPFLHCSGISEIQTSKTNLVFCLLLSEQGERKLQNDCKGLFGPKYKLDHRTKKQNRKRYYGHGQWHSGRRGIFKCVKILQKQIWNEIDFIQLI